MKCYILYNIGRDMAYGEKIMNAWDGIINGTSEYVGTMDENDPDVATAIVGAPACGDVVMLQAIIKNDIIEKVVFTAYGCTSAMVASELGAKKMTGLSIENALSIRNSDIAVELSLPPVKWHCSVLVEDAIKKLISNYQEKKDKITN